MNELHSRLVTVLGRYERLAVAVSGGVDSLTLAWIAHRHGHGAVSVVHAVSPAVPPEASARVRAYADRENWALTVLGSGEFDDPSYRNNPVDRCYFCKGNLYRAIAREIGGTIASGANLDDLDDYRPGLMAAAEHGVVHPFVEAKLDKAAVRSLASLHGLDDISDMPAQPCLASRIETGLRIEASDLAFIDLVESDLRRHIANEQRTISVVGAAHVTVRCRVTHQGVVVELDGVDPQLADSVALIATDRCLQQGRPFAGIRSYKRGAAFLGAPRVVAAAQRP